MKRLTKQIKLANLQFVIALFFIFDLVAGAKLDDKVENTNHLNHPETASILTNYHSDAEQITRQNANNFENKSNQEQAANLLNGQISKAKYDTQLKVIRKRSARNYNFGLGKRDVKPHRQYTDEQIKELLNYLYNINFNSILNYIYGDDEQPIKLQPVSSAYKLGSNNIENGPDDDSFDDFNLADKYKSKRDTQQRLNRYAFGLGKKKRSAVSSQETGIDSLNAMNKRYSNLGYGYGNRFDEYMKRRYSFGIGKRSV